MNKTLPYSEPLIGRAIAGKKHPISDPENAIGTAKKSSILLLSDTLELKKHALSPCKIPFIQWYQLFQEITCVYLSSNFSTFFHQIFTKSSPSSNDYKKGDSHE